MKKLFAAGLVLVAVGVATARPIETERAPAKRPLEGDRAPARRPVEVDRTIGGRALEPGWVAADALWLFHVDVGALKGSAIGGFILENPDQFDLSDLDEFEQEVGLSLLNDFMSFTLYGFSDDPEDDGVIIAVTTPRADEAMARLKAHDGLDSVEVRRDGYPMLIVTDGGERHYLHVRPADRPDQRIAMLATSEDALLGAIRVIDGKAPGLAPGRSAILDRGPNAGSIVFVACRGGELLGMEPGSEILRLSDGITVDIGETGGQSYGEATISANSEENAANINDVLQGMLALGRLIAAEEPQARPLANLCDAVAVTTRGRKISVRISFDAEQLIWILGALDEM
ncbi:MAG: hypothetical protein ACYSU7_10640 [Planctomycetota bacterium]|jgi:hypothetical protein